VRINYNDRDYWWWLRLHTGNFIIIHNCLPWSHGHYTSNVVEERVIWVPSSIICDIWKCNLIFDNNLFIMIIEKWDHAWCDGLNGVSWYLCLFVLYTFMIAEKTRVVYVWVIMFIRGWGNTNDIHGCVIDIHRRGEHEWFHS